MDGILIEDIIIQAIGIVAMGLAIFSFQSKESKGVLYLQVGSSTAWAIHFLLLGAYTGAILNAIAIVRNLLFSFKRYRFFASKWWIAVFSVIFTVVAVLTWEGWLSILPLVGMVTSSFAFFMKDANKLRYLYFLSSPPWLIYDAISKSIGGTITEAFCMISIIIALIRYSDKRKRHG